MHSSCSNNHVHFLCFKKLTNFSIKLCVFSLYLVYIICYSFIQLNNFSCKFVHPSLNKLFFFWHFDTGTIFIHLIQYIKIQFLENTILLFLLTTFSKLLFTLILLYYDKFYTYRHAYRRGTINHILNR